MDLGNYIKSCLKQKNLNVSKLADLTGKLQPNLALKFKRNSFYFMDLEKYANILNATLQIRFIDNETGLPLGNTDAEAEISTEEIKNGVESTPTETPQTLQQTVEQTNRLLEQILALKKQSQS